MNIIHASKCLKTIQVTDRHLRKVLISTAQKIEEMLASNQITLETELKTVTPHGVTVLVHVESKGDKPSIYTYTYMVDINQLESYLRTHPELCEGPLCLSIKGIDVVIPYGPDKLDKVSFSFNQKSEFIDKVTQVWLPLPAGKATFRVHRDVVSTSEWACFYDNDEQQ